MKIKRGEVGTACIKYSYPALGEINHAAAPVVLSSSFFLCRWSFPAAANWTHQRLELFLVLFFFFFVGIPFLKKFISLLFTIIAILQWKKGGKEGISIFRKKKREKKKKNYEAFSFRRSRKTRNCLYCK